MVVKVLIICSQIRRLDDKDFYCIAEASTWTSLSCTSEGNKPETNLSAVESYRPMKLPELPCSGTALHLVSIKQPLPGVKIVSF